MALVSSVTISVVFQLPASRGCSNVAADAAPVVAVTANTGAASTAATFVMVRRDIWFPLH
jgi:hypothetical protein